MSDTCGGHKNSCGLMEKINPRHPKLLKRIHVSIKVFTWPAEPVGQEGQLPSPHFVRIKTKPVKSNDFS